MNFDYLPFNLKENSSISQKRFIKIGSLYYNGKFDDFINEMIILFKEVKVNISNVINKQSVMTFDMTEKDIEQLIQNRNNLRIINRYKERNNPKDQSVIVVEKDGKERFVFTNVAISTLRKRLSQENVYEYFIE